LLQNSPLYVEYEGTVWGTRGCLECAKDYTVGDVVKSYVRIDADLAPADRNPAQRAPANRAARSLALAVRCVGSLSC